MDERLVTAFAFIEASGYIAPILFILFHILRQFLFIPVSLVCMAGGILFGSLLGTVYSLIGLTLLSIGFYFVIKWLPGLSNKLFKMKEKWFGQSAVLTTGQISILKLIPFFHYQLLNLCLVERKREFPSFTKASLLSNLPLAFFYTVFGQYITRFSPTMMIIMLFSLVLLFYVLREKVRVVQWNEFFETSKG
jgi:uncharacterized membrane protein YdjX (TVP38/TMEM64 family)